MDESQRRLHTLDHAADSQRVPCDRRRLESRRDPARGNRAGRAYLSAVHETERKDTVEERRDG